MEYHGRERIGEGQAWLHTFKPRFSKETWLSDAPQSLTPNPNWGAEGEEAEVSLNPLAKDEDCWLAISVA